MKKTLKQNLIKGSYEKPTADILLNDVRLDVFPLILRTSQGWRSHWLATSVQHCTKGSSQGN